MTLHIMLVDDNLQYRDALKMLLDLQPGMEVVCELPDGLGVLDAMEQSNAHLILMDIGMQSQDGRDTTKLLLRHRPELRIIALSAHAEPNYVTDMMRAGAKGYVVKGGKLTELLHAIQEVSNGREYIDSSCRARQVYGLTVERPITTQ